MSACVFKCVQKYAIGFKMHISSNKLQPATAGPSKKSQPGGGRSDKVKDFYTKTIKLFDYFDFYTKTNFLITLLDLAVLCAENIIQHRPTWRGTGKPFPDFKIWTDFHAF